MLAIAKTMIYSFLPLCRSLFFIAIFCCQGLIAAAQQQDSAKNTKSDSTAGISRSEQFINMLRQVSAEEARASMQKYKEDRIETKQEELLEKIRSTTLAATNYIKIGPDTTGFNAELEKIMNWYAIAGDGIFINSGSIQTSRNLEVSRKILKELLTRINSRKTSIDKYYKTLRAFRNTIDSLNADSTVYSVSSDSATAIRYFKKLLLLAKEIGPADSAFKKALVNVASLQTKLDTSAVQIRSDIEQLELFQKYLADAMLKREVSNITGPVGFARPFKEILSYSAKKEILVLFFYVINNARKIVLVLILITASWQFLRSLKQQLKDKGLLQKDYTGQLVLRYPFLSAVLLTLSLFQFIFIEPAFIFDAAIWIVSGTCLTIIFRGYIAKFWMYSWLILFGLFVLATADNLVLQASRAERWYMLILSVSGAIASLNMLLRNHKKELKEKWILYFIALVAAMELAAVFANIYGRYNFSKSLLTGGFFNVIIGILLLWVVRLINQGLSLASLVYETPDKKLFYINFRKLGNKVPRIFYVFLIIGWMILLGRNFYSFKAIADPVNNFLAQQRTLGNYEFTMYNLLIFVLILVIATVISRMVSFFAAEDGYAESAKKSGIGSWLLLVRIAIISIGLFLAFAAAGIPMDRITIIISALGVGIGFGLQTLVNNLVSGLIISFEKPVNVGDIIEVGSHSGIMKSIGFRSSVLYTWNGADIIIPNGDLLNQHLINWTMANQNRRVEVPVGVAYGTDLEKARQLLLDVTTQDDRILKSPPPVVLIEQFNKSSIDLKLQCWVRNVREWRMVNSDIIASIDKAFKNNNITIPFPQQDVYIHAAEVKLKTGKEDSSKE